MKLEAKTYLDVLKHLGIILGAGAILLLFFFRVYLPIVTNHGESITVPNLEGIHLDELNDFLTARNLRFEVTLDSSFSAEYPPLAVLKQTPRANSKVKENRKIYVTLNATNPPKVKMPYLVDGSLKNAQMVLQSYGLLLGEITYKAHRFQNAVLEQRYQGKAISEGTYISKGSKIDLVVGNGLGNRFPAPDLTGFSLEEAEFIIIGSGLRVGKINWVDNEDVRSLHIVQQYPTAGMDVRTGNNVDLWVVKERQTDDAIIKP
jgi:eukaryotic-like serine/threonine-protein kinase